MEYCTSARKICHRLKGFHKKCIVSCLIWPFLNNVMHLYCEISNSLNIVEIVRKPVDHRFTLAEELYRIPCLAWQRLKLPFVESEVPSKYFLSFKMFCPVGLVFFKEGFFLIFPLPGVITFLFTSISFTQALFSTMK